MKGKLYLLPNLLDESLSHEPFFPGTIGNVVSSLQGLICESEKSARRYLRRFLSHEGMAAMPLRLLNEHSSPSEKEALLEPIVSGEVWGLISDAGLPCIADPGSDLVFSAHQKGINIEALVGPCSIIMALQLSGFSGQRFAFHGYLPREREGLESKLKQLEKEAVSATQIWIEAPYRSMKMVETLKSVLSPATYLSVAISLTLPTQRVLSLPISLWQSSSIPLEKEAAVFSIVRFS